MAGVDVETAQEEEEEEEEAAVSTSPDGDGAANIRRGRARRTIGMPDAAAVLARVSLTCKTEPTEGWQGRGTVEARGHFWCQDSFSYSFSVVNDSRPLVIVD